MSHALDSLKHELRALNWDGQLDGGGDPRISINLRASTAQEALTEIEKLEQKPPHPKEKAQGGGDVWLKPF